MPHIKSGDAEIFYEVLGDGPAIVMLHPFPGNHEFWMPAAKFLQGRYRLILLDLRGHGDSGIGAGPATMSKHAEDIRRVMDHAGVGRAGFCGASIGGYVIFECWRQFRERMSSIVLCNTKAAADSSEARLTRLKSAGAVIEEGTEQFFQDMVPKLIGETTRNARPDLVQGALTMMRKMSAEDVAMVQQGMAARPDSFEILKTINVPTMIVAGSEDVVTGMADVELMRRNIPESQVKIIPKAGHFAAWESPTEMGQVLRGFFDSVVH